MLPIILLIVRLPARKQKLIWLQYLTENCLTLFRNLVLDYGLAAPGLFKAHNDPLIDHVIDYLFVLDIVEAAIAHHLALVELAVF